MKAKKQLSAALVAASLDKKQVFGMLRNQPSRILPKLRDTLDSKMEIPEALKLQAIHYFGSLRKAIMAAE